MAKEPLQPQPIRLSHFSIDTGAAFLRSKLLDKAQETPLPDQLERERTARETYQLESADRFIQYFIEKEFPKRANTAGLLNETTLLSPSVERALAVVDANGKITNRLKLEMVRKMLITGISQELDERSHAYQMRGELQDIHTLLDERLFVGKVGQTFPTTTYSVHEWGSNEVVSVGDTYPVWVKPGRHVKKFIQQMRYVDGVGYVLSSVREKSKEASILKTLRRSVQKREEAGDDRINPLDAVKDSMGLMFIVKGAMRSTNPQVEVLKGKVLDLLREKYGEIHVQEDNVNGNGQFASQVSHANYQRVQVSVNSLPVPIELMFYGEGDAVKDTYAIGRKDKKTGRYSGNAHRLFEIDRMRQVIPVIFPEIINGDVVPGYKGLDKEAQRTLDLEASNLRRERRIMLWQRPYERGKSRREFKQREQEMKQTLKKE